MAKPARYIPLGDGFPLVIIANLDILYEDNYSRGYSPEKKACSGIGRWRCTKYPVGGRQVDRQGASLA